MGMSLHQRPRQWRVSSKRSSNFIPRLADLVPSAHVPNVRLVRPGLLEARFTELFLMLYLASPITGLG